eukprot:COSAG01_NODE_45935_length_404_cov_11.603279_1_plen_71_part_00
MMEYGLAVNWAEVDMQQPDCVYNHEFDFGLRGSQLTAPVHRDKLQYRYGDVPVHQDYYGIGTRGTSTRVL